MKKLLSVLLAVFLILIALCACEQPSESSLSEGQSSGSNVSQGGQKEDKNDYLDVMRDFEDLSGEKIPFNIKTLEKFELDYVVGWNLVSEEFKTISEGSPLPFGRVSDAYSSYTVKYEGVGAKAVCDNCFFGVEPNGVGIRGVFVLEKEEDPSWDSAIEYIKFYPYYDENGEGFYFLDKRNETSERLAKEAEKLVLPDGTEKKVQPLYISCDILPDGNSWGREDLTKESLGELTGNKFDESLGYIEATVYFENISFEGRSQAWGEVVCFMNVYGTIKSIET